MWTFRVCSAGGVELSGSAPTLADVERALRAAGCGRIRLDVRAGSRREYTVFRGEGLAARHATARKAKTAAV